MNISPRIWSQNASPTALSPSQLLRDYRDDTEPSWHLWHMATLSPLGQTHRAHISKHHKIETPLCCSDSLPLSNSIGEQRPRLGSLMGSWFNLVIERNWLNETKQQQELYFSISRMRYAHTRESHVLWIFWWHGWHVLLSDNSADVGDMSPVLGELGDVLLCLCFEY